MNMSEFDVKRILSFNPEKARVAIIIGRAMEVCKRCAIRYGDDVLDQVNMQF